MKYFLIFLTFTFSIQSKERIVVLDFVHPANVSREMAVSSYKYFVSELAKTDQFTIIEKSQMKEVLKEVAFQQSGCTDTACEIQIGQILYANKIASGNIIKKGKKYIIAVNIRNVKDQSLEFAETIDLYDLSKLEIGMNSLAKKISGNSPSKELLTREDIERIKRNQELDGDSEMERVALLRTLVFPGWGHSYWKERKRGSSYTFFYVLSLVHWLAYIPAVNRNMLEETKREVTNNRVLYYFYASRSGYPIANNPLALYNFTILGDSAIDGAVSAGINRAVSNSFFAFTIMVFALSDIQSIRKEKEKQPFSFSVKPESSLSFRQTSSYPQKGTHLEFSYTMRF